MPSAFATFNVLDLGGFGVGTDSSSSSSSSSDAATALEGVGFVFLGLVEEEAEDAVGFLRFRGAGFYKYGTFGEWEPKIK